MNRDPPMTYMEVGAGNWYNPYRRRLTRGNERSIVTAIYNRIAMDCAAVSIEHVRLDDQGRYQETINSDLNECLTVQANIDQTARNFIQDIVLSMFDEGCVAIVPVETDIDPLKTGSYDIKSLRTGRITEWFPEYVRINVYNKRTGLREDITLPKKLVAIVENPLYPVMNEPNSTLQRLIHKLNLLDVIDEESGAGKLDLIIQLPYTIKTETRRKQAEERKADIERQLAGSKYGIAYTDATEHVTQLNRPVENNLLNQITYLTDMVYSQIGIDTSILNQTADENTMNNYNIRIVEPIVSAIVDAYKCKFLTKTARSQKQSIMFFRDPFKFVPVTQLADASDKYRRNEIMSANEVRQKLGMKPSLDEQAETLRNPNLNAAPEQEFANTQDVPGDSREQNSGY